MLTRSKLYILMLLSFLLLFASLYISFKGIDSTSKMIEYIEKAQLELNYQSELFNTIVQDEQMNVLSAIILNKNLSSLEASVNSFDSSIDKLMSLNENSEIRDIIVVIKRRIVAFKIVEKSLFDAYASQNREDIEDAVIGFNTTAKKFSKDVQRLISISYVILNNKTEELHKANEQNKQDIFISFALAILLILFSLNKLVTLHNRVKKELLRAEDAEKEQRRLQNELKEYSDNLELEVKKKTEEIYAKIYTNSLSSLANRNKLLEDKGSIQFKAIALLNIDKFQKFNDVYGEEVGNIALKLTAFYLKEQLENEDINFYHINGDEFVFALKSFNRMSRDDFIKEIVNILNSVKEHIFKYERKEFQFLISCGISFCGNEKMLSYADMALKEAKSKNIQYSIFNEDKKLVTIHREDIECKKRLFRALDSGNIISYFQPLIPLQDREKVTKYESLVRLREEDGEIIPPFKFLSVAKDNRVYYRITHIVVENSFSTIEKYKIAVSLNLSLSDIINRETMEFFFNKVETFNYNHLLTIELLETEEIDDYDNVYNFCTKVRSYGIKVAIDDFGSGYSNFSHIIHLPIDYIKIDATLISNIDKSENSRMMVETIVDLAKRMHVETIAEFVSSKEIYDIVTELNVDYAQGYYGGKPEPIEFYLS